MLSWLRAATRRSAPSRKARHEAETTFKKAVCPTVSQVAERATSVRVRGMDASGLRKEGGPGNSRELSVFRQPKSEHVVDQGSSLAKRARSDRSARCQQCEEAPCRASSEGAPPPFLIAPTFGLSLWPETLPRRFRVQYCSLTALRLSSIRHGREFGGH